MLEQIKQHISNITQNAQEIENLYTLVTEKHSSLDKYVVQLLHEIELNDLSAVGMSKQIKELKGVLKLRRQYKDYVDYLIAVRVSLNMTYCKAATKSITELEKQKDHRKFKTRIKEELRLEVLREVEQQNVE